MSDSFVHLRAASSYSLRYGTAHPELVAYRAAEHGMDAVALTDRDGLYGAVKHVRACRAAGIRPVLGADLALPDGSRTTFLARGRAGWASLCRLVSAAHLEAPRGEPVVTAPLVAENAAGLVTLLGPESDVGRAVTDGRPGLARARLGRWRETGCETVIEVVHHQRYGDGARAGRMLGLAHDEGVTAVLSNAVRYLDPGDAPVADVLDAARAVAPLERRRVQGGTTEAYLKSGKEMEGVAGDVCGPDRDAARRLLADTRKLADRCAVDPVADLGMGRAHLPEVSTEITDPYAALRVRCEAGLARRGMDGRADARDRLADELTVIEQAGLPAYFLTVADVAGRIRALGIRCAIRGSGAGSLVTHLLGISGVDPLKHGLLMERFLCEGRGGLPDIDLDVESARRLDAYRAILDMYGAGRCTCVSMMETYRARGAIREVGAALGLPPYEIDAVAKAFPHVRARQIGAALSELPELRRTGLDQGQLRGVFRLAERLDGLPRHIALHPCGVVLSDASLRDRTPVERSYLDFPMSQFDKDDVEEMGLLKLDVIGVRMQSAMTHALAEIHRVGGETGSADEDEAGVEDEALEGADATGERIGARGVDIDAVPRDDPATYDLIRSTRTLGCFQIESPGQRELIGKLEPEDLDDLVLDISLFRPGPVGSDMVTPYLEARHGWKAPAYPHRKLAGILAETGGVVVFHEQVLRILVAMTGCSLSDAEEARRALDDPVGGEEVRTWFQAKSASCGYDGEAIERVWKVLAAFGAFGFCKAHAAAFALPTYQSAWLKAHYPAAFFAGVLTHEPGMYPKRMIADDARHFGVPVLGLDVNRSGVRWLVERRAEGEQDEQDKHGAGGQLGLRVALAEVKGIGEDEITRIVDARGHGPYCSLPDFWQRAGVSRPVVERIVQAGGFDELYGIPAGARRWRPGEVTRRDLVAQVGVLDRAGAGASAGRHRKSGGRAGAGGRRAIASTVRGSSAGGRHASGTGDQLALSVDESPPPGELPEMTDRERVRAELDILGVDVTRHVLSFYTDLLAELGTVRAPDLLRCRTGADVLVAGVKVATQTPPTRSGQRVIFTTLEDGSGPVDVTFFESVQDECAATVFGSWLLVVRGNVRRTGPRAISLRATACWDLAELHRTWREQASAAPASPGPSLPGPDTSGDAPRKLWHASPGSSGH